MTLMLALRSWTNFDHEGRVEAGQRFEVASDYRSRELEAAGLAIPAIVKILVRPDPGKDLVKKGPVERQSETKLRRQKSEDRGRSA